MRTNRTRNLRTENTIQLKILEKKHLPAQMHWEERKMTQRSGKNSCSSNQDQMFNAVQWGTNSQHINSFMLCRVVCVPDVVAFCACVFFSRKECNALPSHHLSRLPRPNLNRPACSATYFQLFFFFVQFDTVQHSGRCEQTWGEKVSLKKKCAKIRFYHTKAANDHLLKWIRRENP